MRTGKSILFAAFVVMLGSTAFVKPVDGGVAPEDDKRPPFLEQPTTWADSVFATLTPDERIAQLLMVAAYSNQNETHTAKIEKLITEYKIGGLIFMKGTPMRQAKVLNKFQSLSKVPLMVSIDGEWGLAMRLDSTVKYPWQMTLGAIQDESLIYQMGVDIGEQCKRLGIHVNFAPVVDVNVNPKNPIINARSFGEDKKNVASKGIAYMKGMQAVNVIANAKHFPGHGDTDQDSHKSLPTINHPKERIDSIELYPFYELINNGLASMMVAHLYIPAYVKEKNMATTLSKDVVTDLLKDSLGFEGLIFTDALNMKGVSSLFDPGVVDVKALLAGNDILLFSGDVATAITEINKAVERGEITREEIDKRCLKVLRAKEWAGLNKPQVIDTKNLYKDLNQAKYESLNRRLSEAALTVLKNDSDLIPIRNLTEHKMAVLSIGEGKGNQFQSTLGLYHNVDQFAVKTASETSFKNHLDSLKPYSTVIVGIHKSNKNPWKSYKISSHTKKFITDLSKQAKIILVDFANPYSLIGFREAELADALIVGYQNSDYAMNGAAGLIFGGIGANGKLPVSVSETFKAGDGLDVKALGRFKYTDPEELGINGVELYKIDSIAMSGILEEAYPGCQVLVAQKGKVIYNKSFGYHTYEKKRAVKNSDLYDIASITKIAATLFGVMRLQDQEKFHLDSTLGTYLGELIPDSSEYHKLVLREILAHQSGLQAWVPFYIRTIRNGRLDTVIYRSDSSTYYPYRVAKNIYINKEYPDEIYQRILRGPIKEKEYRYSDLGYYFLQRIVEVQTGEQIEDYVAKLYAQMGMTTTGYLPRKRFNLDRIPPTEYDEVFRKQVIHGDVHDPGAAMLGGVGGHAGLFSNANDLAKLMQMYLNGGTYGSERYIRDTTLGEFTKCQYCIDDENRRGAGFDKPVRDGEGGPTCNCVSYLSFGHSGFTGTIAWADPEEEIVYIFLSNRIYPDAENKKLLHMNIRTDIQQVIYNAINNAKYGKAQ